MCMVNQTLVRQLVDSGWMCGQPDFGKAVSGQWLDVCGQPDFGKAVSGG